MAKDPAILLYTSDFLTGTADMDDEQVGRYIKLLCLQHQKGHLKERTMFKVCKGEDEDILEKFEKDENGLYFNVRLEEEILKRQKHSKKQRDNVNKRWNKDTTLIPEEYQTDTKTIPLEDEDENVNIDVNSFRIKREEIFELARNKYPGKKRGLETEFKDYKKHKDWKDCLTYLMPAISNQINYRESKQKDPKAFIPEWKHFKTWINQRDWEMVMEVPVQREKKTLSQAGVRKYFKEHGKYPNQ